MDQPAQVITITGQATPAAPALTGFGNQSLADTPMQITAITQEALQDAGVDTLADLTRFDASMADAYNTTGYWQAFSIRGYTLDNQYNYRRDGLPVNAETAIPLENKQGVEILHGLSGQQAGTSAPGGIVNFSVKRPQFADLTRALLSFEQYGTTAAAIDIDRTFGDARQFGMRLNAAAARLSPSVDDADGQRAMVALAGTWRMADRQSLEAEVEWSRQAQPSVPGFSLLGGALPSAKDIDPDTNLNNQPWSQPVIFKGTTGSLRYTHPLGEQWRWVSQAQVQRLRTDDRAAFPFGCSADDDYGGYCSDGSFDLYDYRSDDERRRTDAFTTYVQGQADWGAMRHTLTAGWLYSRYRLDSVGQAYNWVGTGTIDGETVLPPDPTLNYENTERNERSQEFFVRDVVDLSANFAVWGGLRHTRLHRASVQTDGSERMAYADSFTTPWLTLVFRPTQADMAYLSWGEGVESSAAPDLPIYTNAGATGAAVSRQWELGYRHTTDVWHAGVALFDIVRPAYADYGTCDADETTDCLTYQRDGDDRHRGIELSGGLRSGAWSTSASAMWLDAERRGSADDRVEGRWPTNVPHHAAKLQTSYRVPLLQGLTLSGYVTHEGRRAVLPDNSIELPSWTRLDLGARYAMRIGQTDLLWRAGIDNVTDRRAWRESPYQYDHVYLFPMERRTWRISLQVDL